MFLIARVVQPIDIRLHFLLLSPVTGLSIKISQAERSHGSFSTDRNLELSTPASPAILLTTHISQHVLDCLSVRIRRNLIGAHARGQGPSLFDRGLNRRI